MLIRVKRKKLLKILKDRVKNIQKTNFNSLNKPYVIQKIEEHNFIICKIEKSIDRFVLIDIYNI